MSVPPVSIIGTGSLGTALARALNTCGIPVKSVYNRSLQKAEKLAGELGIPVSGTFPTDSNQLGTLVFITVADRAIAEVAEKLAASDRDWAGYFFVHCSGNETHELLEALRKKGATVASFHPLQTFSSRSGADDFREIYFSVQGDYQAYELLDGLAEQLGAHAIKVSEAQKSRLHAAAVFASNYLNTLLDTSTEVAASEELSKDEVRKFLLPLVKTTLKNAEKTSFRDALSGPIKRGDAETVRKHLRLLEDQKQLQDIYRLMGIQTLKIAEQSGSIDGTAADEMRTILYGNG